MSKGTEISSSGSEKSIAGMSGCDSSELVMSECFWPVTTRQLFVLSKVREEMDEGMKQWVRKILGLK